MHEVMCGQNGGWPKRLVSRVKRNHWNKGRGGSADVACCIINSTVPLARMLPYDRLQGCFHTTKDASIRPRWDAELAGGGEWVVATSFTPNVLR
jgi:hypothetical protein